MAAVPIKPEYGPTLGRLLAPRWHAARPRTRRALFAVAAGVVLLAIALALTLENAHYSHGGPVPFGFEYRGLDKTAPEAGGYVRVTQRDAHGGLRYSYEVDPLVLPPYKGNVSGALPVFASHYLPRLAARFADYAPRGEGRTRVNGVPGYQLLFSANVAGREIYGRDVLLLPPKEGATRGVSILMLTAVGATAQVEAPVEVGTAGVLLRPLKTFSFG
ncbi:MAG TPA: hypothetical protein VGG08_05225 [Solirubrobacteraceae bacterium]|jgi:hypothetical protein